MSDLQTTSLKSRVLRAGGWNFAGYGLGQAIRLGSNLLMTRLLVPEMFGIMAIATMVSVVLALLSDLGVRQNIVQSLRGDDPAFLDTAWVIQIARGFGLWVLALGICAVLYFANLKGLFPAKSVYAAPELPLVIAATSLESIISGFQSTKIATAYRRFDQKRIVQIELISQLAALVLMIAIALIHRSIWALVAGGLVASVLTTVLSHSWLSGHGNRFRLERDALRELIHFGRWIFVSSIFSVLTYNGDRLLLGALVDTAVLGVYAIAALMIGAIGGGLSRFFAMVSLPALSETLRNHPSQLRDVYYRLRIPGDVLLLFLAGLLFAAGQLVVDFLFDPRYSRAGGMLQVLALALFMFRYGVAHQVYLALGMPRYLAVINAVNFASLYFLVPLLYYLAGAQTAIWGIALHAMVSLPIVFGFNARHGMNDFRRELAVLAVLPIGWMCGSALNLMWG